jgi:hypothetical protein
LHIQAAQEGDARVRSAWCADIVPTIVVDASAPCPVAAVREAAAMWGALLEGALIEVGPMTDAYGTIMVRRGDVEGPLAGFTLTHWIARANTHADITVEWCDARMIAHELGHALGFDDIDDPDALMSPSLDTGGSLIADTMTATYQASRGAP